MNDPLGDMLTRIRNAQMRGKSSVNTPASKLRRWVLDVLKDEGYIRGYEKTTGVDGHPALEISLKYFDGEPVIKELKRISKPGRRVYSASKEIPSVVRAWRCHRLDTKGRDVRRAGARCQCWRRSALPGILKERFDVSCWKFSD